MPGSKRRSSKLTTDDSLVRLLCLPEEEQNTVLDAFDRALRSAEARVIRREAVAFVPVSPSRPSEVRV